MSINPPPTQEGFDVDPEWLFNVKEENAPPHILKLKRWCVYRLLRNVSLKLGMGTPVKFQLTGLTRSGCGLTGRRISRDGMNGQTETTAQSIVNFSALFTKK